MITNCNWCDKTPFIFNLVHPAMILVVTQILSSRSLTDHLQTIYWSLGRYDLLERSNLRVKGVKFIPEPKRLDALLSEKIVSKVIFRKIRNSNVVIAQIFDFSTLERATDSFIVLPKKKKNTFHVKFDLRIFVNKRLFPDLTRGWKW